MAIVIPNELEPLLVSLFFATLGIIIKVLKGIKSLEQFNEKNVQLMVLKTAIYGWIAAILVFSTNLLDGNIYSTILDYTICGYVSKTVIDYFFGEEDSLRSLILGKFAKKTKNGK